MNTIEIKSICDKIISGEINYWISDPIDGKIRFEIHKYLDLIPELKSESIIVEGISGKKKIKISKNDLTKNNLLTKLENMEEQSNELNSEKIEFFNKFSKLPIPTNSPENLSYYLENLTGFYNTSQYNSFVTDIKMLGYSRIKNNINETKDKIIETIKSNEEYKKFLSSTKIPSYPDGYVGKSSIYNSKYTDKYFLSIDIKSANWMCLKRNTNLSFNGSWTDFVGMFTQSKFIQESKYFREIVFGELGSKKIDKFMSEIIYELEEIISKSYFSTQLNKICCTRDEIIYEIIKPVDFDFVSFVENIKQIDPDFSIYRVESFYLRQLKPYDYFIKEIDKSNDPKSHKIQFKNIPKHFVLQVIKYYTKKPIDPLDKKFMFENFICSFDNELHFE